MKTRRAPGCNRRRQGDTDEWLKVRSLQSEGEGGLSGCGGALCVCVSMCVCLRSLTLQGSVISHNRHIIYSVTIKYVIVTLCKERVDPSAREHRQFSPTLLSLLSASSPSSSKSLLNVSSSL